MPSDVLWLLPVYAAGLWVLWWAGNNPGLTWRQLLDRVRRGLRI